MTTLGIREQSVAMTSNLDGDLRQHLLREDGQEDICFALWRPSTGNRRVTALLTSVVLPLDGEREVHGNASFSSQYFLRAAGAARQAGAGLALLHSHPGGTGWQGMSPDDHRAEQGHAAQTRVLTGRPLVGLTLAGDSSWSARTWLKANDRQWHHHDARTVRVVGSRWRITFNPRLAPMPTPRPSHLRTASAWGRDTQADIERLRVGVVGAGSVGGLSSEGLQRIGIGEIGILDFDTLREHNLDRQLHATMADVGSAKAKVLADALRRAVTSPDQRVTWLEWGITEPEGFAAALDYDVLFSCVDRPWARAVLNFIAYAHGIPVIDGGVAVRLPGGRFKGADWRAHIAAPGRRCLECLGQYDPGLVEVERTGLLDDSTYLDGLPVDHALRRNENVFTFSMGCASLELAQFVAMVVEPNGVGDIGALHFHLTTGRTDVDGTGCRPTCPYDGDLALLGDDAPVRVIGSHPVAAVERASRGGTNVATASRPRRLWRAVLRRLPSRRPRCDGSPPQDVKRK